MARTRGQIDERRMGVRFRDQHGRPWEADVEKATGAPVGAITPLFTAPLIPPQGYLRGDAVEQGVLHILYVEWIKDAVENEEAWQKRLEAYCRAHYGDNAPRYFADPPAEALRFAGPKPMPWQPIKAAMDGKSAWVLGSSTVKPEWARAFFPDEAPASKAVYVDEVEFADEATGPVAGQNGEGRLAPHDFIATHHSKLLSLIPELWDEHVIRAYMDAEAGRVPPRESLLRALDAQLQRVQREALAA